MKQLTRKGKLAEWRACPPATAPMSLRGGGREPVGSGGWVPASPDGGDGKTTCESPLRWNVSAVRSVASTQTTVVSCECARANADASYEIEK